MAAQTVIATQVPPGAAHDWDTGAGSEGKPDVAGGAMGSGAAIAGETGGVAGGAGAAVHVLVRRTVGLDAAAVEQLKSGGTGKASRRSGSRASGARSVAAQASAACEVGSRAA